MATRIDEQAMIAQLKAHDEAALMSLVTLYGAFIRQVVWHQLRTAAERSDTADVENRIFYKVWAKIDQFDPARGTFEAWLGTIAKHQALDYQRGLKASLAALDIDTVILADQPPAEEADLEALFAALSAPERQVFERYFVQQQTVPEIAKALHIKPSTVYQHISRGRKKLRQGGESDGSHS
ncbi:RNA polymerase sigma factor [Lacticaseibacillus jixianensis]|uniref:RNA polymerase sigma factor n=1 Tax=Lacticaseibacillus jixianensis TaxID=2486012 RepID=A0ABW4B643_9LACO|nr:sigma-70 family RNA polymerase sigma factor [Lacticaseibacillus jixianensis]